MPAASDLVEAFVCRTFRDPQMRSVRFGKRGSLKTTQGYICVWGPTASANPKDKECHIILECRYDGISVTAPLAAVLGRSAALAPANKYSAGPRRGRFKHEFLVRRNQSATSVVDELIAAMLKACLPW